MRPACQKTTRLRVTLAVIFALALPPAVLAQVFFWLTHGGRGPPGLINTMTLPVASIIFGVLVAGPYVLGAMAIWAVLHKSNRHYWWAAALTGLATGGAVVSLGMAAEPPISIPILYPIYLFVGLSAGLCIWFIAYGRQSRLPQPAAPTKPAMPLVL